jgi:hypothetical protein
MCLARIMRKLDGGQIDDPGEGRPVSRGTEGSRIHRWKEMDTNLWSLSRLVQTGSGRREEPHLPCARCSHFIAVRRQ